jgi:hypothetical protein
VACINHSFFLALFNACSQEAFLRAFIDELDATGIPCEVMRTEPYHLCGVRYDGLEGVKL